MPIGKTAPVIEIGDVINYGLHDPNEWVVTDITTEPYTKKALYLVSHLGYGFMGAFEPHQARLVRKGS